MFNTSVVNLTLLYINFETVIPAEAGIQIRKTGFPGRARAGRVKPGMTIKVKLFMTHYTRTYLNFEIGSIIPISVNEIR